MVRRIDRVAARRASGATQAIRSVYVRDPDLNLIEIADPLG
ncbi:hypothetical protein ACEQUB_p01395 (plasmid) [Ralstonia syzygii]|uniref:Glyoxalase/bleomycin resistance protein/dioxygenase n=1 Tax=Ralstonia syzygii R24 TaxID=907261 RepID=G3ABE9_9RALS|nr:hypothetical protein LMG10661_03018 [Ralstonia syzygii subsp. syzygii]CCA86841.1 hypothetical protein RALSY_mp30153 [Ralstonia syzygii R24]